MGAAVLVVLLQVEAIARQSLVADAPLHLAAGYQALRHGTNTLNLEHPPLPKLVGARSPCWEPRSRSGGG